MRMIGVARGFGFTVACGGVAAAVLAVGVASEALGVAAQSSARRCKSPTAQPPNRSTRDNVLNGVAPIPGCKSWAVGSYTARGGTRTLILYWNRKRWKVQRSPNPGQFPRTDELSSVAATSPTNAWAVGTYVKGSGRSAKVQTLVEHWDGTAWKVQKSPNPGGHDNHLNGVIATSATNAWAVGDYSTDPYTEQHSLILHWDGTAWKVQPSPNPGGYTSLHAVAAISPINAWAVGGIYKALIEHWNGKAWRVQKSPSHGAYPSLNGVAATSATNAWAVGDILSDSERRDRPLIERWNGNAWKAQKSPSLRYGFSSVAATSATNAWAMWAKILRWNGNAWNAQKSPSLRDSRFSGVAATSATNAWAVGTYNNGHARRTLALHWNGTAWAP